MSSITVRVDASTKAQAEALFSSLGMTVSGAISVFLAQSITEQAMPFRPARKRLKLEDYLTEADFNSDYTPQEWDTGKPAGREVL